MLLSRTRTSSASPLQVKPASGYPCAPKRQHSHHWAVAPAWDLIRQLSEQCGQQTLSILEVSSGAGDLAIGLAKRAKRYAMHCRVEACDGDLQSIVAGRFAAGDAGVDVEFYRHEVADSIVPMGYDVIVGCYDPETLEETEQIRLMQHIHESADRLAILCLSEYGRRSASHVGELAERAGMQQVKITRRFPGRLILSSSRG